VGKDSACVHADNSMTPCRHGRKPWCDKTWHHNWVHDCRGKCMRGDDFTTNLTMHHNVIYNCGMGPAGSDGMGQSFGVVLKGDYNKFYQNTVLRTHQADIVLATGPEGPNRHSMAVNNVASRWTGKKGPVPPTPAMRKANNWGGNVDAALSALVDFSRMEFRPRNGSAQLIGTYLT
jgi:hypothetical protein